MWNPKKTSPQNSPKICDFMIKFSKFWQKGTFLAQPAPYDALGTSFCMTWAQLMHFKSGCELGKWKVSVIYKWWRAVPNIWGNIANCLRGKRCVWGSRASCCRWCWPTSSVVWVCTFSDELTVDYIFTFNLSYEENKYYTKMNFMNTPPKVCLASFYCVCLCLSFSAF